MTPQLKQLATFAAEFLEFQHDEIIIDGEEPLLFWPEPYSGLIKNLTVSRIAGSFFEDLVYAPILMHLGKREMEKQDYYFYTEHGVDDHSISITPSDNRSKFLSDRRDNNEFIAFWSAVRNAFMEVEL